MKTTPFKGELQFESVVNKENSYSSIRLAENAISEMIIEINEDGKGYVEWEIPELDEYETIGLWFEGQELIDYDGCFELPKQLIKYLENQGFDMDYAK